jgi:hypothetical protein
MHCVDRHRFDADPDPTFHFDADPHPDSEPDPTLGFTHVVMLGNQIFYSQHWQFTCFTSLISVLGVIIFIMLDSTGTCIVKFSGKKYNLALQLLKWIRDQQAFNACRPYNNIGLK